MMKNTNPWMIEGSSRARMVWVTPEAEEHIAYIARVSNPKNQENEKFEGLLKYCIKHGHVSVFEQASMCEGKLCTISPGTPRKDWSH